VKMVWKRFSSGGNCRKQSPLNGITVRMWDKEEMVDYSPGTGQSPPDCVLSCWSSVILPCGSFVCRLCCLLGRPVACQCQSFAFTRNSSCEIEPVGIMLTKPLVLSLYPEESQVTWLPFSKGKKSKVHFIHESLPQGPPTVRKMVCLLRGL
jgi:hypothetical protein